MEITIIIFLVIFDAILALFLIMLLGSLRLVGEKGAIQQEGRLAKILRVRVHPLIWMFLALNLLDCLLSLEFLGTTEANPIWSRIPVWYKLLVAVLVVFLFRNNPRVMVYLTTAMVILVAWNLTAIAWSSI
jgi:hypothetical protein